MAGIFSTIPSELHQAGLHGHGSVVPVRQTVLTGRVDSNGQANFLEAGTGLTVNLKAADVPVEVAFAAGFHKGALDYVERLDADVTAAWTLPENATSFLYIDRDANTGLISYGFTQATPHYGSVPPSLPEVVLNPPTGGIASASAYNTTFTPAKAFDGNASNYANSWVGIGVGVWLQYQLPTAQRVTKYKIAPKHDEAGLAPKKWQILASTDGESFKLVDEQSNITGWSAGVYKEFAVANPGYYSHYRIAILEDVAGNTNRGSIGEWGFTTQDLVLDVPWFDLSAMEMKVNSGGVWVPTQQVFVGEAVTNGTGVVSVITYALQGRYDSGWMPVSTGLVYVKDHNIGEGNNLNSVLLGRKDSTYDPMVISTMDHYWTSSSGWNAQGASTSFSRLACKISTNSSGVSNRYLLNGDFTGVNASPVVAANTPGEYRITIERTWGRGGGSVTAESDSPVEMGATEVPVRQTVLDGRTDAEGRANFLYASVTTYSADLCTGGTPISGGDNASYPKANAFDNSTATLWVGPEIVAAVNGTSWIGYQFATPRHIRRVTLNQWNSASAGSVTSMKIQRQVAADWVDVHTASVVPGTNTVDLPVSGESTHWRLLANSGTQAGSNSGWNVHEVEMMEMTVEGTGLTVDLKATEKPVVMAFADGFGERGAVDYVKRIAADIPAAWTLPANATSYLYVDLDVNGNASFGLASKAPFYAGSLISVPKASIIPTMSGFTSGTITVSSSGDYNADQAVWKAFDKAVGTSSVGFWQSATLPATVDVDFGRRERVTRYMMRPYQHPGRGWDPKDWTLEARNSTTEPWVILDTKQGYLFPDTNAVNFDFDNGVDYQYYRLNITAAYTQPTVVLDEFDLISDVGPEGWFDLSTFKMKIREGGAWIPKRRLFIGEAITNETTVTSVVTYALQGRYDSGRFPIQASNTYVKSHNIGVSPRVATVLGAASVGGTLSPFANVLATSNYYGAWVRTLNRTSLSILTGDAGAQIGVTTDWTTAVEAQAIVERGW